MRDYIIGIVIAAALVSVYLMTLAPAPVVDAQDVLQLEWHHEDGDGACAFEVTASSGRIYVQQINFYSQVEDNTAPLGVTIDSAAGGVEFPVAVSAMDNGWYSWTAEGLGIPLDRGDALNLTRASDDENWDAMVVTTRP